MRMYDLILKNKQGKELNTEEINWMIKEFTEGRIPDYQMSAMTMAICFQGMDKRETFDLTMAMRDSGDVLDLSRIDAVSYTHLLMRVILAEQIYRSYRIIHGEPYHK